MKTISRYYLTKAFYILIDFFLIYSALFCACLIRHTTVPFDIEYTTFFLTPKNPFRFVFIFWMATTILYLHSNDLHQTKRGILDGVEFTLVLKSILLSSLVTVVVLYGVKIPDFPRTILVIGTFFNIFLLSVWRFVKRMLVSHFVSKGYNNFNALIVGAGKVGEILYTQMESHPELGLNVVGYLDDYKKDGDFKNKNIKIIGKLDDLEEIVKQEFVNKVFFTIHPDGNVFLDLIEKAQRLGVAIHVIPEGFDLVLGKFRNYQVGFIPILEYCDTTPFKELIGKRLFDFVVAFTAVFLLAPIFICISILIKLDSSGPIFYISRRYGRGGKVFPMYKFRSMCMEADDILDDIKDRNEVDGPIFKIKKDPRITKMGKILRKYSLDELPQFLNVLKGEMSVVGPRPLPMAQIHKEDLRQLKRLEVRPGITGLWQVRGRSDISFARLLKWDIWYINNWSFWLDLNILWQTIPVVLKGRGAY